jgi:uncharacterized protein YbaP (TraB family)
MNKLVRLFIIVSGAVIVLSQAASAQIKTAPANGIFYKITGKGLPKPSYLFGTVHVICPNDMFSSEKLGHYLDQTDRLVMELNLADSAEMIEMAKGISLPAGKTLRSVLTPEQYAMVDEMIVNSLGFHADNVSTISPVVLQVMILSNPKAIGCPSPSAYELMLTQLAANNKKPVEGLESARFQREAVEKIPLETQAKMLYEMAVDYEKSVQKFKELVAVYKLQDSEKLFDTINSQIGSDKDLETQLVGTRNKTWIPKIEALIKEKSSFIAVGGGHLGGPGGLVNELRNKGYRLEVIRL